MKINNYLIAMFFLLLAINISCQTKKIINFDKYETLSREDKKIVKQYIEETKNHISKKDEEIILMFQYNCFFNKTLNINNKLTESFPKKQDVVHYGQKFVHIPKNVGNITINQSDGKKITILQKKGYDYITVCYYEKEDTFFIHYYDFPKLLIVE
ncbi:hypothetical protein [Chryseobacterium arthrosphaerae]|uniref:hypothetical protein n=1 Tax=Chryseobacterium arthrosphaerae TaxID=651561 RepID=UPI00241FC26C|nr:hypothetical protein [Chryseobacterium arthrosphaerae]